MRVRGSLVLLFTLLVGVLGMLQASPVAHAQNAPCDQYSNSEIPNCVERYAAANPSHDAYFYGPMHFRGTTGETITLVGGIAGDQYAMQYCRAGVWTTLETRPVGWDGRVQLYMDFNRMPVDTNAVRTRNISFEITSWDFQFEDGYPYQRFNARSSRCSDFSVRGEIGDKWNALGGERGRLGGPTSPERCGYRDGGCFQTFAGGAIYWTPRTGAHPVWGAIAGAWAAQKWETGRLGYPVDDEYCGLRDRGCLQRFEGGTVYWSERTGAHPVWGAIADSWATYRWETGRLGYPVSDEFCGLPDGGCFQRFAGGAIYWSPRAGAHPVWGRISERWAGLQWERGRLGYPTSDERCGLVGGGCWQAFQGGRLYWSPATDAQPLWGAIAQRFDETGYEHGRLGYPTGGEACGLRDGGCFQSFQQGSVYWSPASGAWPTWGAIGEHWASSGWERGQYGYPTGKESCRQSGPLLECTQQFQGGVISFRSDRGTF